MSKFDYFPYVFIMIIACIVSGLVVEAISDYNSPEWKLERDVIELREQKHLIELRKEKEELRGYLDKVNKVENE